jgi:hypothetical protein
MTRRSHILTILSIVLIMGAVHLLSAETFQTEETESWVKELGDFHEIIYPIWHTAYPEKDYEALRGFVPEINRLAKNLFDASLPGILRDKKSLWDDGLEQMKKAVEDYNEAAAADDDQALLDAAEELHAKFEMMVRIIRPVLKEIDEFHKVLYVVYHKHLPDKEYDAIRSAADDFIQKAEAIMKAELPKRLEAKAEEFSAAAQALFEASKKLKTACQGEEGVAIEKAVEFLHTKYQELEKIFD